MDTIKSGSSGESRRVSVRQLPYPMKIRNFSLFLLSGSLIQMAHALNPGDIAVIGYNTSGSPDSFTIVTLVELPAGTAFFVSDNEVSSAGGSTFVDLNEGEALFSVKAGQTIAAGTVITLPWG